VRGYSPISGSEWTMTKIGARPLGRTRRRRALSPTLKRVGPYRIFIWSEENRASFEPPHVHVSRGSVGRPGYQEAEMWLGPPVAVKESGTYSERELAQVKDIVERWSGELRRRWNEYFTESG
jgi:hypothetical protein